MSIVNKPTLQELIDAYSNTLGLFSSVQNAVHAHDAYEVYILSLVIKAAQDEGANVRFEDNRNKKNPAKLIFRSSPGNIYSIADAYTHAVISFPNLPDLEAHSGVYVQGLARVVHECDVMVIEAEEAMFCRSHCVHPKKNKVLLATECKLYTDNLGIRFGREFIGMTADLGKDNRFLFSNSLGTSVEKILEHHNRKGLPNVSPLDSDMEGQAVSMLREAFRSYKIKKR